MENTTVISLNLIPFLDKNKKYHTYEIWDLLKEMFNITSLSFQSKQKILFTLKDIMNYKFN